MPSSVVSGKTICIKQTSGTVARQFAKAGQGCKRMNMRRENSPRVGSRCMYLGSSAMEIDVFVSFSETL
jgi:hypothetical protein